MKTAIIAVLVILTIIFTISWLKWKTMAYAFIYYMEKNQYKQPNREDMAECTDFVVKNAIKGLIGN